MWDLIVSVPDHCLSFYFSTTKLLLKSINTVKPSDNNYVVCSLVR